MTKQKTKQKTNGSQHAKETPEEQHLDQESEKLPIGKLLRQVREKKALTIHDISRETNISSSNLTSIELGDYNELPADTFIRGQIIIYADFLGLDGKEAARLFFEERTQCTTERERKRTPFSQQEMGLSTKELAEPAHISSATWAISLLLLILTFLAVFSWYTDWNPFAYFFQQEPARISTVTTVAQPAPSEQESEEVQPFPLTSTQQQTVDPSSIEKPPQKVAQTPAGAANETIELNTAPE